MRTTLPFGVPATAAAVAMAMAMAGCNQPKNQGTSGYRMDPARDANAELRTRSPRSQDLTTATNRMAQDIAKRLDVNDPASPPRIYLGEIENRSELGNQDYQIFLVRLRSVLQSSGARHGLEFVRERAYVEDQRAREYGGKDEESTAAAYESRADYVLTCEVYDMPSGGTNYFLFDYQLVQLREAATGPDVGAGAIVWENMYEVKYQ